PLLEPATVAVHAARRSGVRLGDTVAVIGVGTVGALTLQAFKAAGARVIAIDLRERSLQMARSLGADDVVDASGDAASRLSELTGGIGPDMVVETAGAARTPVNALEWVRRQGTIVLVGIYAEQPQVDFNLVVGKELTVTGSVAASPGDMEAATRLAAEGRIRLNDLVSDRIPLNRVIEDGFERMLRKDPDVFRILVSPDA
ncbi:MAG: zinc-dependent alcohol dehydrogenase, partial [Chloroflexota bacterium]